MKYLYYYIWLGHAKLAYGIGKIFYWLRMKIRNTPLEVRKIDEKEMKRRIKYLNIDKYNYPDGITHWHTCAFIFAIFLSVFFIIPFIVFIDYTRLYINQKWQILLINAAIGAIIWYIIYNKKSNKEWLKKKINKKAKEFYL